MIKTLNTSIALTTIVRIHHIRCEHEGKVYNLSLKSVDGNVAGANDIRTSDFKYFDISLELRRAHYAEFKKLILQDLKKAKNG